MLFRQIFDERLAQYAYLIGCQQTGEALIVDPERDIDRYVSIAAAERNFVFRYKSPAHWVEFFRTYYGPVLKAFAAVDAAKQKLLEADILALIGEFNTAKDGTAVIPGEYLEVVVTKQR